MVADGLLVRRDINAVDLVISDVALDPLHSRQGADHAAGFLRDGVKVRGGELAGSGDFAFD
jgi:hypothetical protein